MHENEKHIENSDVGLDISQNKLDISQNNDNFAPHNKIIFR